MASIAPLLFDGLLALGLIWLAWRALACVDLFKAIVLFVAFGLLLALVWVRLSAPDVALAEAAIGAGVTGALLLAAWARLEEEEQPPVTSRVRGDVVLAVLLSLIFAALALVVQGMSVSSSTLQQDVMAQLDYSGVEHPVTAVLLNFRGYDTLLEILVLLLALLAVWSLGPAPRQGRTDTGTVLAYLSRLLTPLLILIPAYLLWLGAHAPGGAFQAGAVLAAGGILLLLSGWRLPDRFRRGALRGALLLGPMLFLALAVISIGVEGRFLQYPPAQAGTWILLIETAATLSIAVTLMALFIGGRPGREGDDHE